jgi:GTP-binding protein
MTTLLDYHYKDHYEADKGQDGDKSRKTGANGGDMVLPVPVGTRVITPEGEVLCDLVQHEQEFVLACGGRGGRGNARFATSRRQAPDFAQPGEEGEETGVRLELVVLADVGLVGFPNAGKSSLIRVISKATPKVADYPFTTLTPNLGVVEHHKRRFVIADLPGLIEGASDGKGLGYRFLKHLSRTQALTFVLALDGPIAPPEAFRGLVAELQSYDERLLQRPILIMLSKCDLAPPGSELYRQARAWEDEIVRDAERLLHKPNNIPKHCLLTSGIARQGLKEWLHELVVLLEEAGMWAEHIPDHGIGGMDEAFHPLNPKKRK